MILQGLPRPAVRSRLSLDVPSGLVWTSHIFALWRSRESTIKVCLHTPGYAPSCGPFSWCNFGVNPSPNHANPCLFCTQACNGVGAINY